MWIRYALLALVVGSACPSSRPPPTPLPRPGPCSVNGRPLNSGEQCHVICSSPQACRICCDNNNNPPGCRAACNAMAKVDGAETGSPPNVIALIPSNVMSEIQANGLELELQALVEYRTVAELGRVAQAFSGYTQQEWADFAQTIDAYGPLYWYSIKAYARASGLDANEPSHRSWIVYTWWEHWHIHH